MRAGIIRPLALCIIRHNNKLFVMDGYDEKEVKTFYRLLGGGIELGEYGEDALKREFQEELNAELKNIKYLTTIENIFTLNGKLGHEIVLVYEAELATESLLEIESTPILDSKVGRKAFWIDEVKFKNGELILYPNNILKQL